MVTVTGPEANETRRFVDPESPFDIEVRCVCSKCNNEWLSDIEKAAQRIIKPMMRGQRIALHPARQRTLGTWAFLRAIIGRYMQPVQPVERDWLDHAINEQAPPPNWWVFVGAYSGGRPAHAEMYHLTPRPGTDAIDEDAVRDEGLVMTIVAGYFALKVIFSRKQTPAYPGAEILLPVWPPSELSLLWPPELLIGDGPRFQQFLNMWLPAKP